MSKLHAVGVGRSFNLFKKEDIDHVSLEPSGGHVLVDNEVYELEKATTFEESQKVDDLLDGFGELRISDHAIEGEVSTRKTNKNREMEM